MSEIMALEEADRPRDHPLGSESNGGNPAVQGGLGYRRGLGRRVYEIGVSLVSGF